MYTYSIVSLHLFPITRWKTNISRLSRPHPLMNYLWIYYSRLVYWFRVHRGVFFLFPFCHKVYFILYSLILCDNNTSSSTTSEREVCFQKIAMDRNVCLKNFRLAVWRTDDELFVCRLFPCSDMWKLFSWNFSKRFSKDWLAVCVFKNSQPALHIAFSNCFFNSILYRLTDYIIFAHVSHC